MNAIQRGHASREYHATRLPNGKAPLPNGTAPLYAQQRGIGVTQWGGQGSFRFVAHAVRRAALGRPSNAQQNSNPPPPWVILSSQRIRAIREGGFDFIFAAQEGAVHVLSRG
jgi:hypothetical protein